MEHIHFMQATKQKLRICGKHAKHNAARPEGSALLIALMMMSILITLSLGINQLLITTLRDTTSLRDTTRAWYAAEGGIERALASAYDHGLGFEEEKSFTMVAGAGGASYTYKVHATASNYPENNNDFATLHLNESVTIPLFRGAADDSTKIKKFRVEYFLSPELTANPEFINDIQNIYKIDLLRWKLFGINAINQSMEVMNEFAPMEFGKYTSDNPSCIGTGSNCHWNGGKFFEPDGHGGFDLADNKFISDFLNTHSQVFLVLTNVFNTDLLPGTLSTRQQQKLANIRYRIKDTDGTGNLTLPFMFLSADGTAGTATQSIDLALPRPSFLPVFNFALYRTVR